MTFSVSSIGYNELGELIMATSSSASIPLLHSLPSVARVFELRVCPSLNGIGLIPSRVCVLTHNDDREMLHLLLIGCMYFFTCMSVGRHA